MADQSPFDDVAEMERCGFSDYHILIISALSEFLWKYDTVQRIWQEQSGSFAEPLERLNLARLKVRKFFDPQTVTPPGQTGIQFGASLFNLIEEAWHLCRFVRAYPPHAHPQDADGKRLLNDMLSRPPVIREEIRKAWLHLKHVALLEARDVSVSRGIRLGSEKEGGTTPEKTWGNGDNDSGFVAATTRSHSPDFRSVNWYGTPHEFTPKQADCVKVLWDAWQNHAPAVGDATVLELAESDSERLPLVFRDHAAWGTMIVDGQTKGTHRLADPPEA